MTDQQNQADRIAKLNAAGVIPMTAEEILAGTQAGIPRPSFLKDHEDDGTVDVVDPHAR